YQFRHPGTGWKAHECTGRFSVCQTLSAVGKHFVITFVSHEPTSPAFAPDDDLMAHRERPSGHDRERRYEHPIPSRDEICKAMEQAGKPLPLKSLAAKLGIHTDPHRRALENRLKAMVRDGQLIRNRAGELCLTKHLD